MRSVTQHDGQAACIRTDDTTTKLWETDASHVDDSARDQHDDHEDTVVELVGVSKRFGGRRALLGRFLQRTAARRGGSQGVLALDNVDLRITGGQSLAIVGESGSGKSTLLRVLAGLTAPDSGEVRIHAEDRPQMIYQDATLSLTPWLTVEELVSERLRRTTQSRDERRDLASQALRRVGLPPVMLGRVPAQLSGGQRQRVAIARAIVVPPTLLLCDEPTSSLDVSLAAAILNLLLVSCGTNLA